MPSPSDRSRQPWSYQNLPTEVWDQLQQTLERFEGDQVSVVVGGSSVEEQDGDAVSVW